VRAAPSVRLANDIAAQFDHRRDPDAAAADMAEHLRSFWEGRMIEALRRAADDPAAAGLHPLAARAAHLLR
jgi:formate dehydrogenase subunit delta